MPRLHRYWIRFRLDIAEPHPPGTLMGVGVTAYDREDALGIVSSTVFSGDLPEIETLIEDVDLSTLDQDHVTPNSASPLPRGIWFPLGYQR